MGKALHVSFKKCLLVVHDLKPQAADLSSQAKAFLQAQGLLVDEIPYEELIVHHKNTHFDQDFALVFGGDGLCVLTGRSLAPWGIPVLAINMGRVGFLTGFSCEYWQSALSQLLCGSLLVFDHDTLEFRMDTAKDSLNLALNEVFFVGQSRFRICEFDVQLDHQVSLGNFRADGLMIATPTGSTAYALSCGGPMVTSDLHAMLLLAINPYAIAYRPMVISGHQKISIRLSKTNTEPVLIVRDGHELGHLGPQDHVQVSLSDYPAKFVYPADYSFYQRVCDKIGWHASILENSKS